MKFSVKYAYICCGASGQMAIVAAGARIPWLVLFGFFGAVANWYLAEYLLSKEKREE